jgi:hypothetical protein
MTNGKVDRTFLADLARRVELGAEGVEGFTIVG